MLGTKVHGQTPLAAGRGHGLGRSGQRQELIGQGLGVEHQGIEMHRDGPEGGDDIHQAFDALFELP